MNGMELWKIKRRGPEILRHVDHEVKIFRPIYQKQSKKKFPTIRFYNLLIKNDFYSKR